MHFHCREPHSPQGVQEGDAGMGIGTGIDDDAVLFSISLLDGIHQVSLMVGLVQGDFDSQLFRVLPDHPAEVRIGGGAVDPGFTDTQHIQVRTVDDKDIHGGTSDS